VLPAFAPVKFSDEIVLEYQNENGRHDQNDEYQNPSGSFAVVIAELLVHPKDFRLLGTLPNLFSGLFVDEMIIEHRFSPFGCTLAEQPNHPKCNWGGKSDGNQQPACWLHFSDFLF